MTELASLWLGCKLLPCKFPLIWLASISIVWPLPWSWPRLQKHCTTTYSVLRGSSLSESWLRCMRRWNTELCMSKSLSGHRVWGRVVWGWFKVEKELKKGKWETVRILSDPGNYISSWHTSNHFGFSDDVNWRFLTSGMSELSWFPTHLPAFRLSTFSPSWDLILGFLLFSLSSI